MTWPEFKLARELSGTVFPVSEAVILATARKLGIGKKIGRAVMFSPKDCEQLYEALPCPSNSLGANDRRSCHPGNNPQHPH